MNIRVISLAALVFASSCQTRQRMSPQRNVLKESPQTTSQPETLGLGSAPNWRQIKEKTAGGVARPWSDSAWTIADGGLARRSRLTADVPEVSADPLTLEQQVRELRAALDKRDARALALLSPAEKYDILATGASLTPESLAALDAAHAKFEARIPAGLKDKRAELSRLQDEILKADDRIQSLLSERRELAIERERARRALDERRAGDLRLQLDEKAAVIKDWESRRDESIRKAAIAAGEIKSLLQPVQDALIEEVRALKPFLPMTAGSWEQWLAYATNRYDDGRRLGHQHGWAPASLLHAAPRHGVVAKKGDLVILFTEGDIRGLLSKLYAEQGPRDEAFFAARCKGAGIAQAQRSALFDGLMCLGRKSGSCSREKEGQEIHVRNNRIEDGLITFSESSWDDGGKVGVVLSDLGQDYYALNVFDSTAAFEAWFQSGGQSGHFNEALLHLTQGCRGTTPLTFHVALTKLIAEGTGVVLEEVRGGLAWRHPAYRYELDFVPIVLNKKDPSGKTLSKPGEPAPVGDVADVFRAYRAPRTAYLLQVQAKIFYAKERASRVHHEEDVQGDDGVFVTTYTLELDDDKKLVGGQWGLVPFAKVAEASVEREMITGEGPDLLWYYSKEGALAPTPFDRGLIMKLHDCSREGPTTSVDMNQGGEGHSPVQARICNF